jgi:two-component system chemotaxis response regulator CheB
VPPPSRPQIVAIGASTGGPEALQKILTRLPGDFPIPILVVQHIAPGFASSLVEWLAPQCALALQIASSGVLLAGPGIWVAPTGQHLTVLGHTLRLSTAAPVSGHRPSATVLFQSVARHYGATAIGVLLTGMGEDGATGLEAIKRSGGITMAQDQSSSVVFGMPAVAIGRGVVDHILAPERIPPLLLDLIASQDAREG